MRKEVIAKQLVKIAKNLVSEDWQQIFNIKELEKMILKEFGEYASKIKLTFSYNSGKKRIQIISNNISQYSGVFKRIMSDLQVSNFGGSADIEKRKAWVPIDLSWKFSDGGMNEHSVVDFSFDDGKWYKK